MIKAISDLIRQFFVGWEYTHANDIIDIITIIVIFAIVIFVFKIFRWVTTVAFGWFGGRNLWY